MHMGIQMKSVSKLTDARRASSGEGHSLYSNAYGHPNDVGWILQTFKIKRMWR